jgi:HEXXH motif-containing protein
MWGAITLNALRHTDAVDTATTIAHEAAHLLLFAEALHEPLVSNDESETFPSPLRRDPRPMDGIYHATFVVARTHFVLERITASNQFPRFAGSIAANMVSLKESFAEGLSTVSRHARLTDTGRRLIDAATSYMSNAA